MDIGHETKYYPVEQSGGGKTIPIIFPVLVILRMLVLRRSMKSNMLLKI